MRDLMENMVGHHLAARKRRMGTMSRSAMRIRIFRAFPIFTRCRLIASSRSARCTRFYARANSCTSRSSLINADDYYGVDAFKTIYAELSKLAESGEGTMVGYDLCNTVSEHGTVTRGVCHVNEQGMLDRVVETFHLKPCADGKIRDIQGKRRRPGLRARDTGLDELLGLYAMAV